MGSISARERVAIVFMTMSVLATLVLGGALVAQLGRPIRPVARAGAAPEASEDRSVGIVANETATDRVPGVDVLEAAGTTRNAVGSAVGAGPMAGNRPRVNTGAGTGTTRSGPAATRPGATPGSAAGPVPVVASGAAGDASGAAGDKGPDNPDEGVTGDFITVGGIYDETGPLDASVHRDTVRAYFNQVNAAGGVKGRKLRLLDCDSGFDPSRAHQCSLRLLSQKILGIVGWISASGEEAETKFFTGEGVPMIGGLSVPAEFNSPMAFPTTASLLVHGTAMGHHAKDLNLQTPGIIILNTNVTAPFRDSLLKALHEEGIRESSVETVEIAKPDYSDLMVKFRAQGAKSIISVLDPFSSARMFQAMERQDFEVPVFGYLLDKKSANEAYGRAAYGGESLVPVKEAFDPANARDPDVVEYFSAVQRYFPNQMKALDYASEAQWAAAKVFVEALRRIPGQITRQSLVAALHTLKDFRPGLVPSITYEPGNHEPNRCFQWIRNDEGTWRAYSDWKCF